MLLSERTLEELWQLFPILLTPPNPAWKGWYADAEKKLRAVLPAAEIVRIEHIGSTALGTIWAKPTVDILVETCPKSDWIRLRTLLEESGWHKMSEENHRMIFQQGYTEQGFAERVFHLHLRCEGDSAERVFRDYLATHPADAQEYEQLKRRLWKTFEHHRDAYTEGKTAFVQQILRKAQSAKEITAGKGNTETNVEES